MVVTWTAPSALWLLLVVPLVWLAVLMARNNFTPRQRWLQASARSLLLGVLAIALARPVVGTETDRQSIVYAVDVSYSVSSAAIEAAAARIDDIDRTVRPSHSRIVAFGSTVAVLPDTAALRQLASLDPAASAARTVNRQGTDLEAALAAARTELAAGYVPRIVLFTDGRPTAGDTDAAVVSLASAGIPVSVEPLAPRVLGDTWVDRVDLPDRVPAGAPLVATVGVGSQRDASVLVEVRSGGAVIGSRSVTVGKGMTDVAVGAVLGTPGLHVLQASVTTAGDPLAENNTLERGVWADPKSKVLYVEGVPSSARYLSGALAESGFDVAVRPAAGIPSTDTDLNPFDVVVLSDVARDTIGAPAMRTLGQWVERSGGGLLVAGGAAVFGERGYRQTEIERLAPVTFERRDEPSLALVLVLDHSWSMNGKSMELCKSAAQAAVDVMADEQAVGVLTFDDRYDWNIPLRKVGANRADIRRKIADITAGGETLIFPALEQAYLALRTAKARVKHVVLLSDGKSYPDEYEALVGKMVKANITVSTVAVGPSADPELLRNIAQWGRGRAHRVADASELPQIFVKEAKDASRPAFDENNITPVVKTPAFLTGVDLKHLPPLLGRTATVLKDTALEVLATPADDPLLAFWPIGLGRTAVFASDVKDRWAARWVVWREYGPFFTALIRALERRRPPAVTLDAVAGPVHGAARPVAISVEARDTSGRYRDLLRPVVTVREQDREPAEVNLRQVAPGRYEASVVANATRPLTIAMSGAEAGDGIGVASRVILPDPAAELRFRPGDEAMLRSIATATGGAWHPASASLASSTTERRLRHRQLWPALVGLGLALWFVDLALRRVRLFDADGVYSSPF
jgi:Ca-activated chloride channel family protein